MLPMALEGAGFREDTGVRGPTAACLDSMPDSAWPRKTRISVKEGRDSCSSPLPSGPSTRQPHGLALKQNLEALAPEFSLC